MFQTFLSLSSTRSIAPLTIIITFRRTSSAHPTKEALPHSSQASLSYNTFECARSYTSNPSSTHKPPSQIVTNPRVALEDRLHSLTTTSTRRFLLPEGLPRLGRPKIFRTTQLAIAFRKYFEVQTTHIRRATSISLPCLGRSCLRSRSCRCHRQPNVAREM